MAPYDGTTFAPAPYSPSAPDVGVEQHPPFSVEDFAAFCRTKPANELYVLGFPRKCALGQYVTSRGGTVDGADYVIGTRRMDFTFVGGLHFGLGNAAYAEPHTFGAALSRCEAHLAASKGGKG